MSFSQLFRKYLDFCLQDRRNYFISTFLLIVSAFLLKLIPFISGLITENILSSVFEQAINLIAILFVVKVVGELIRSVASQLMDFVLLNAFKMARLEYIVALQNMDYDYHTNKSSGSLISLAKRGETAIFSAMVQINEFAFTAVIEFVVSTIALWLIHPLLGLILLVLFTVNALVGVLLVRFNISKRMVANDEDDKITGLTVDNLVGFETVKIFGQEEFERQRFKNSYVSWYKAQLAYVTSFRFIEISLAAISSVAMGLTMLAGVYLAFNSELSVGQLVAAFVYVYGIGKSMNDLVFNIREIAKNYTDLKKYFEAMALRPKVNDAKSSNENKITEGTIEIKDLSFNYPNSGVVLKNINTKINKGETIALVGESGSGKTTFGRLLLRFYDPEHGTINIDGNSIRSFKLQTLRQSIGVVPQEPILFNDTIEYNIAYGKPTSSFEEVKVAAEKAQLDKFITSLKDGYNTIVGERGIKLSGGQKQRLAIARVILENPPIVLFDEATSQLDSATEKKVQIAFENLTRQKTTIIIAHRLSTVKNADRILVFDKGEIVEEGKHADLIKDSTIYKKLWELQTDSYIDVE